MTHDRCWGLKWLNCSAFGSQKWKFNYLFDKKLKSIAANQHSMVPCSYDFLRKVFNNKIPKAFHHHNQLTRWWFQICSFLNLFTQIPGEMIQFDNIIFFNLGWHGSTTNSTKVQVKIVSDGPMASHGTPPPGSVEVSIVVGSSFSGEARSQWA